LHEEVDMTNATMNAKDMRTLLSLNDEKLSVTDASEDVRDHKVLDRDGEEIGTVDDLLVDDSERKVRFLRIKEGGFLGIGVRRFLIPVDAITRIQSDEVHVDQEGAHIGSGPDYDPKIASDEAWRGRAYGEGGYYDGLYGHYGRTPFWGPGYVYPGFPNRR